MRVLNPQQLVVLLISLILALATTGVDARAKKDGGVILNAIREINMSEPDIIQFENLIVFRPGQANKQGERTIFEYVVAVDYADTLVDLEAQDADTNYPLKVTRTEHPLLSHDALQMSQYNSTDFLWF